MFIMHSQYALHRHTSVLLCRQTLFLAGQLSQSAADAEASVARFNHIVDVTVLCGLIGVGEEVGVLLLFLGKESLYVLAGFLLCLGFLG